MDFLQGAISDLKSSTKKKTQASASATDTTASKWKKRGEIRAIEVEEEKKELEKKREKRRLDNEATLSNSDKQTQKKLKTSNTYSTSSEVSVESVMIALRKLGEPITLFGETASMRLQRYKDLEVNLTERNASKGHHNVFLDGINKEIEDEIKRATLEHEGGKQDEEQMKRLALLAEEKQIEKDKYAVQLPRDAFKTEEDYVMFFFKKQLFEWEMELDERSNTEKASGKGKEATKAFKQCKLFIKPLFKLLRKRTAIPDVVKGAAKIVDLCVEREYKNAEQEYLRLAIGNAAWPMGVTAVGIHERAGRSRLFAEKTFHVLNDEIQRKYIHSLKTLMSHCQKRRPSNKNN